MVFTDPYITLHEMPRIRLWEELRDNMRDRRRILEQIAGWYPSTPAMPSLYQPINRLLTHPSGSYFRSYIDNVADAVFDNDTVVEGPNQPTLKTKAKIHLDAFGFDDDGWDPPGPPNLAPPCIPHADAWDHIRKVILEVDKHWYSYPYTYDAWLQLTSQGDYYEYDPYTNPRFSSWADAKQNALDNMAKVEEYNHRYLGRRMYGYRYSTHTQRYTCNAYAVSSYRAENVFGCDFSEFNEVSTLSRVFLGMKWGGEERTYQRSPVNIDIYIGDHKCNSTKLALDCTIEDYQIYIFELDAFDASNYTFDGTKYNIEARFADPLDGWVDDSELPAPGLGEYSSWGNRIDAGSYGSSSKILYVKPYYFFTWP